MRPGDIIAIDVGPHTPHGFLGKVKSTSFDGSTTVVDTEPATLQEALPEGSFAGGVNADPIEGSTEAKTSSLATTYRGSDGPPPPSAPQYVTASFKCGVEGSITVSGDVRVDSDVEVSASWSPWGGTKARFVGSATVYPTMTLSADVSASCSFGPKQLFKVALPPIALKAGPIPVVVTPFVSVIVSGSGSADGNATMLIGGQLMGHAGLEHIDGHTNGIFGLDAPEGGGAVDTIVRGSAHIEAVLSPTLDLLLYGVGGTQAALNIIAAMDRDLLDSPTWRTSLAYTVTARFGFPALRIFTPTHTLYEKKFCCGEYTP